MIKNESFDHALIREVYEETKLRISLEHVVGASEQNLHIIRAVHIIMTGKIVEGELSLSSEHEGYAWIPIKALPDYELADWLHDYVDKQTNITTENRNTNNQDSEDISNQWIKSVQNTVNKIAGKK